MIKFLIRNLNFHIHNAMIVILRMIKDGAGVNSRGAASLFLVMAVLAVVLAIALGSSLVVSTELRSSSDSGESIVAFYEAETGAEQALYNKAKLLEVPRGNRCAGNCPGGVPGSVCSGSWICTEDALGPAAPYCLEITLKAAGDACNPDDITAIKSVGDNKTTRRSIEIDFSP